MKKILYGIAILILIYLILSHGSAFTTLIDVVMGGFTGAVNKLQTGY